MLNYTDVAALFPFDPAPEQARAVELAAAHKVIVITGGPGTGKTATTKAVINLFLANDLDPVCCAPTGKAAQRMTEQTGRVASTIHRLLDWKGEGFLHDSSYPLCVDSLIVDETSMVDTELFAALVSSLQTDTRLVIVGDVDQLPSIGPGRVLYDLIEGGDIPVVRLTKIYRQAEESLIPYVARDLNNGKCPELPSDNSGDVIFAEVDDEVEVAGAIVAAVKRSIPARGFNVNDIQVLAPQRSRACGVENLNRLLQAELNPTAADDQGVKVGKEVTIFEGDRVIHTKNNYSQEVFNGEIGKVLRTNWKGISELPKGTLVPRQGGPVEWDGYSATTNFVVVVDYGDRKIAYTKEFADDLKLAYAITIHKSQGSQFKVVVMPVHSTHNFMLTRSLVYTGITRASELLVMVGERSALGKAAINTRGLARRTTLKEVLNARMSERNHGVTSTDRDVAAPPVSC